MNHLPNLPSISDPAIPIVGAEADGNNLLATQADSPGIFDDFPKNAGATKKEGSADSSVFAAELSNNSDFSGEQWPGAHENTVARQEKHSTSERPIDEPSAPDVSHDSVTTRNTSSQPENIADLPATDPTAPETHHASSNEGEKQSSADIELDPQFQRGGGITSPQVSVVPMPHVLNDGQLVGAVKNENDEKNLHAKSAIVSSGADGPTADNPPGMSSSDLSEARQLISTSDIILPQFPSGEGTFSSSLADLARLDIPLAMTGMNGTGEELETEDIAARIPGLYRILDLTSEQGSGGLVAKVVIDQPSLGRFINDHCPGTYLSATNIDFLTLDAVQVRPVGLYGSKSEIVKFLEVVTAADLTTVDLLRNSSTELSARKAPSLRSGLYFLKIQNKVPLEPTLYAIYWPEDATWDDNAASAIHRNRVTFMRYLTKISQHVVALISDEHLDALDWKQHAQDEAEYTEDEDEDDRMYTFEVAKSKEQDEDIVGCPGFSIQYTSSSQQLGDGLIDSKLLKPRLVAGETKLAILRPTFVPPSHKVQPIPENMKLNVTRFVDYIRKASFRLMPHISDNGLQILMRHGLAKRAPEESTAFQKCREEAHENEKIEVDRFTKELKQDVDTNGPQLLNALHHLVVNTICERFGTLGREALLPEGSTQAGDELLEDIKKLHPNAAQVICAAVEDRDLNKISSAEFKFRKEQLIVLDHLLSDLDDLDDEMVEQLVKAILESKDLRNPPHILQQHSEKHLQPRWISVIPQRILDRFPRLQHSGQKFHEAKEAALTTADYEFLKTISELAVRHPILAPAVGEAVVMAQKCLRPIITKKAKLAFSRIQAVQIEDCKKQIVAAAHFRKEAEIKRGREQFLAAVQNAFSLGDTAPLYSIDDIEVRKEAWHQDAYIIRGQVEVKSQPQLRYNLNVLQLTEDDKHRLQLEENFIPIPKLHGGSTATFELPAETTILHAQLLANDMCLLVIDDGRGKMAVFLETLSTIGAALAGNRYKKPLNHERTGQRPLFAFDETKRMLAIFSTSGRSRNQLTVSVFDESFTTLSTVGSTIKLSAWYSDAVVSLMTFVGGGAEEIVFVDSLARMRVFSLVTMQFRPATAQLQQVPETVYSAPDGSCIFVREESGLRGFHWSTFGMTSGIKVVLPGPKLPDSSEAISSLLGRTNAHFVRLDESTGLCLSTQLKITRKVTEFSFREKAGHAAANPSRPSTLHNCLLDCHAEVWTRFPVVPAVDRQMGASQALSLQTIVFIAGHSQPFFAPYFKAMISNFERQTRKPTEGRLDNINVQAYSHGAILGDIVSNWSTRCLGEWIMNVLCLIPIHIAIARDNRFVPLKDGVWSYDYERSMLGATVDQIIDSLTFGWYESIFRSYMSSKPVKVVSSMGEQSVGKSFSLNHLLDTSFAGSALRTTEGVWMSVNPTEHALLVALDFEGVHSIERSAQEDTLLVLFNTAISNMVLFRNNFAFSRDISSLFQSFQSSSTVLDSEANRSLFNSLLVIIIKDVVLSDKVEIKKEFSLKFQQIVDAEQGSNFITRLHRGEISIMPWPVIESKQFYTTFRSLRRTLDERPVTHTSAGVFLETMKTLMAKLKANDWGSMSSNMASHRMRQLLALMPQALALGAAEMGFEDEPLRNFDTGQPVESPDTRSRFFLAAATFEGAANDRQLALQDLIASWSSKTSRLSIAEDEWIRGLKQYIENLVQLRADHVASWITANTERFANDFSITENLRREFESMVVDLKENTQFCGLQCSSCQLICIRQRHHPEDHDCQTDHRCKQSCRYVQEHSFNGPDPCGFPAGHTGDHICNISEHLCGKECHMADKRGCLERCSKISGHEDDEHVCPAPIHECSQPCSLTNVLVSSGERYSCQGTCRIPSHVPHDTHNCEDQSCPLRCQLCQRLCAVKDHLHALSDQLPHLCGQEHACTALCQADGPCQIEVTPQSVEATFSGRHEVFQYTKYSQVAKPLPCAIPIPPDQTNHVGRHCHSTAKSVFHYCKTRCSNCGYFCTLPTGHPQNEHETSHGSMSATRWAIDGPEETVMQLDGRRFGINDAGAPLMCNMVCKSMGRHAHVDYCRSRCDGAVDQQHIRTRMTPHPELAKDFITHQLYWQLTGFKDPYSHDEQNEFTKCDAMCADPEHGATTDRPANPSYCTLPLFHRPAVEIPGDAAYVSRDGHRFNCRNPGLGQQAFHVIFVIDRSGSMVLQDRLPLPNTPVTDQIARTANNRLGAVFSSLYAFWTARQAAANGTLRRRDSYTAILFNNAVSTAFVNDMSSTPEQMLQKVLQYPATGGTDFMRPIHSARARMETYWNTDRSPVLIFLSDGESRVPEDHIRNLCRQAVALGKALSFHAVAFGPYSAPLRRMIEVATEVQNGAPVDPLQPTVPSSYNEAMDTVQLANTFLGIADSLRKPRGSLMALR